MSVDTKRIEVVGRTHRNLCASIWNPKSPFQICADRSVAQGQEYERQRKNYTSNCRSPTTNIQMRDLRIWCHSMRECRNHGVCASCGRNLGRSASERIPLRFSRAGDSKSVFLRRFQVGYSLGFEVGTGKVSTVG